MKKRKKLEQLDATRAQFVCRYCQRIYYSVTLDEFDGDRVAHSRRAKDTYKVKHHCPIKDKVFSKEKRSNGNKGQSKRS